MNFVRYLNNRLQGLAVEVNKEGPSAARGAEIDALQFVFAVFRYVTAALFIPKVFLDFVLVNLHVKRIPAPELDLMRAQHESAQVARKQKLSKKVGFAPSVKLPVGDDW